jgi:purine-cytosine permease-like protein|tara:strand:+ start:195 stop:386 length:192 start_codon:yes stop_codon:yes gene_type:complete
MTDNSIVGILSWIVGVLVSLAVGFGMIDGTLAVPGIPEVITSISGWVVVAGAIVGVLLVVFKK